MATDLNPNDVVAWMREQAQRFTEMADHIEKAFKISHSVPHATPAPSIPLPERIRELLTDGKARRAPHIAKELGVPVRQVQANVQGNRLLKRNERGWITLVEGGA
jgi:hypothetical protein